jgi:hypothetical protein
MIQYKCAYRDCPLKDVVFDGVYRRPPACNLGHCRIKLAETVEADAGATAIETEPARRTPGPVEIPVDDPRPAVFGFTDAPQATLVVGARRFTLPSNCELGRRGSAASEAFGGDLTVSRCHARFTVESGTAYLENISERGNVLEVNGTTLPRGAMSKLTAGRNRIRFGVSFSCEIEIVR